MRAPSWLVVSIAAVAASMVSAPRGPQQVADALPVDARSCARVLISSNLMAAWQYAVEYGRPKWKADYADSLDELTLGKRVRLGKDFWTTLDSFCGLSIGGKELKPGHYFLALERSKKGDWSLVALDPEPLRKKRVDAAASAETTGGTLLPLKHETLKSPMNELSIQFLVTEGNPFRHTLDIRFGDHRLSAVVDAKM